jgi:hypothetical protein
MPRVSAVPSASQTVFFFKQNRMKTQDVGGLQESAASPSSGLNLSEMKDQKAIIPRINK